MSCGRLLIWVEIDRVGGGGGGERRGVDAR